MKNLLQKLISLLVPQRREGVTPPQDSPVSSCFPSALEESVPQETEIAASAEGNRYATTGEKYRKCTIQTVTNHVRRILERFTLIDEKKDKIMGDIQSININKIVFVFEEKKATQMAAFFLKLHKKEMKYLGLLKLMYMADRKSLQEFDQPITGDVYISMTYGPVLSKVYDLIKNNKIAKGEYYWWKYIETNKKTYTVKLLQDPGTGELCKAEKVIMQKVYNSCGNYDRFELAEKTHTFPEWRDPEREDQLAIPIDNYDLLKNHLKKTDAEMRYIIESCAFDEYFRKL